jgi:hypothetical protein
MQTMTLMHVLLRLVACTILYIDKKSAYAYVCYADTSDQNEVH